MHDYITSSHTPQLKTRLLKRSTPATSNTMSSQIDQQQLSQWLNAVAATRDKQAFTGLFTFFAPKIQQLAQRKFTHSAQANEVVQETMSNVWRKAHLFDTTKGTATTWVYTIMRNVSFDMLRKIKSNREDNLSDDIWPLVEHTNIEYDLFEDHLEQSKVLAVIDELPQLQQQVVKGFYLSEMSQEQLAVHLNIPIGTVKSRLRLALAKLRIRLGDDHD